ncbi:MAG: Flp pilus assembly protein CpaB [Alphaproteobacteria bacterium]
MSDEIAVANMVRPGDTVDVQIVLEEEKLMGKSSRRSGGGDKSEAHTLLQNVTVLAVGDLVEGEAEAEGGAAGAAADPAPYRTVSLAVTPKQASTLALARNLGAYYLSLRHMEDVAEAEDKTITLKALRGKDVNKRPAPVRRTSGPRTVQIINGTNTQDHKVGGGS